MITACADRVRRSSRFSASINGRLVGVALATLVGALCCRRPWTRRSLAFARRLRRRRRRRETRCARCFPSLSRRCRSMRRRGVLGVRVSNRSRRSRCRYSWSLRLRLSACSLSTRISGRSPRNWSNVNEHAWSARTFVRVGDGRDTRRRDRYTAGHSAAVAVYARDIARRMGLASDATTTRACVWPRA